MYMEACIKNKLSSPLPLPLPLPVPVPLSDALQATPVSGVA